ncbi:hypothetical protein V9T40_013200 [Parthenolecanium corni]|uniref:Uncharacterized protein n=1 Tax=Parthenolecanium corni TaxID=536013 RepID=A0AAN9TIN9_9HEMI
MRSRSTDFYASPSPLLADWSYRRDPPSDSNWLAAKCRADATRVFARASNESDRVASRPLPKRVKGEYERNEVKELVQPSARVYGNS